MHRPSALGLILCDQVILDSYTAKRSYIGSFDSVTADEFPFVMPPFTVYSALTDGQGRITLELRVTDIDGEIEFSTETLLVEIPGPLDIAHVRFRFRRLTFPHAGQYLFELFAADEAICHRRLQIHEWEDNQ